MGDSQSLTEISQWFRLPSDRKVDMFIQPCTTTFSGRVLLVSTYQEIRVVARSVREAQQRVLYRGDREGDRDGQ